MVHEPPEHKPAETAVPPPPADQAVTYGEGDLRVAVPPWIQLVVLPLVLLFGWLFVSAAHHAVFLFLIAGLISLLLNPVVRTMTRSGVPRPVSVLVVFTIFSLLIAVMSIALVNVTVDQVERARDNLPEYVGAAEDKLEAAQRLLDRRGIDVNLRDEGQAALAQLEATSLEASRRTLEFGRDFVTTVAEAVFNLILVIVITIYMLLDAPRIARFVIGLFPRRSNAGVLTRRVERQLVRYVRGQLLVSTVMGASAASGLWVMGAVGFWPAAQELALPFGLIVAVTEVAPSIGPFLGSIPPVIAALLHDPVTALVVAAFFVALHQLEGHYVVPKLMGTAVGVHPLIIIFGIIAGAQILGIGGIILVLPLLAVGKEVFAFMFERFELAPWRDGGMVLAVAEASAGAAGVDPQAPQPPLESPAAGRLTLGDRTQRASQWFRNRWQRRSGGADTRDHKGVGTRHPRNGGDA